MKNKFLPLLVSSLFLLTIIVAPVFVGTIKADDTLPDGKVQEKFTSGASSYKLINPIGNISEVKDQDPAGLSGFINLLIKIAIAMAGAIAVVIIIVNGIQYMGTGSVWEKGESKAKMGTAIGGIILLLCSYLILYTINPDLVNIKIGIGKGSEQEWKKFTTGEDGKVMTDFKYNKTDAVKGECLGEPGKQVKGDCVDLTTKGWTVKNGKYVSADLATRLDTFKSKIDSNSKIKGNYQITEAMPQSSTHKNECHKKGQCVDFSFTDKSLYDDISILKIIDQNANQAGLCSVFEGKPGDAMVIQAKNAKLGAGSYGWVTARHFSIYGWTGCQ